MIKNKQKKSIFILSFIFLILLNLSLNTDMAYAEVKLPEPSYEFYVYDEVGVIKTDVENYIIDVNKELNKKTGVQVVVAVVDSLEDLDINTYATSLYEKWKIGSKEYDNGLLMLVAYDENKIWIETGYGLEGALPAGRTKTIIEEDIIPSFKNDDYNEGIALGFNKLIEYIEKDYDIVLDKQGLSQDYYPEEDGRGVSIFPIIILLFIFGFIDIRFFRGMLILSILRSFFSGPRGPGGYGGGGYGGGSSGGSSGGGGRSGGGGAGGSW